MSGKMASEYKHMNMFWVSVLFFIVEYVLTMYSTQIHNEVMSWSWRQCYTVTCKACSLCVKFNFL